MKIIILFVYLILTTLIPPAQSGLPGECGTSYQFLKEQGYDDNQITAVYARHTIFGLILYEQRHSITPAASAACDTGLCSQHSEIALRVYKDNSLLKYPSIKMPVRLDSGEEIARYEEHPTEPSTGSERKKYVEATRAIVGKVEPNPEGAHRGRNIYAIEDSLLKNFRVFHNDHEFTQEVNAEFKLRLRLGTGGGILYNQYRHFFGAGSRLTLDSTAELLSELPPGEMGILAYFRDSLGEGETSAYHIMPILRHEKSFSIFDATNDPTGPHNYAAVIYSSGDLGDAPIASKVKTFLENVLRSQSIEIDQRTSFTLIRIRERN